MLTRPNSSCSGPSELRGPLLAPRSVALIGASNDSSKTAARPLRFLRHAGFPGKIYPINKTRDEVLGERAWRSLGDLPEVPEHAYVLTPTESVIAALEECASVGVQIATVLASGFGEAGEEGLALEQKVREIVERTELRVVGPSSLGVVDLHSRLLLTANAAFAEPDIKAGSIFVASHSGSMIGAILSRGKAHGVSFAGLVSVGNEVDLSIGEICETTLESPNVGGYLLFIETLRHADKLRSFAYQAAQAGKPIIAYKLGRSAEAAELSVSHTGALAGDDAVADEFLAACGIARVNCFETLFEGLPLLKRIPLSGRSTTSPRVGIVSTTGGGAAMVLDELAVRGASVQAPTTETRERFAKAGISANFGRVVDLTLAGARPDVMAGALDIMGTAPEFDLIVVVVGSSARFNPDLAVHPILEAARRGTALAVFLVPEAPETLDLLARAEIANFRTPEACADAIAAAFRRRASTMPSPTRDVSGTARLLDELESYRVLAPFGIQHAKCVSIDDGQDIGALSLNYPVAIKVLSSEIAHKTDIGGVIVGVGNGNDLRAARAEIQRNVSVHLGGKRLSFLVQEMASGVGEALVGYRIDRDVGPLVVLAAGGTLAELLGDRSIRLAPFGIETAREMISEVKAFELLKGFRGRPAGDLDALAEALVRFSRLVETDVVEAEINPLIVRERGAGIVAVDALVRLPRRS